MCASRINESLSIYDVPSERGTYVMVSRRISWIVAVSFCVAFWLVVITAAMQMR